MWQPQQVHLRREQGSPVTFLVAVDHCPPTGTWPELEEQLQDVLGAVFECEAYWRFLERIDLREMREAKREVHVRRDLGLGA